MNSDKYDVSTGSSALFYTFMSSGPNGNILKGVQFSNDNLEEEIYDLALVQYNSAERAGLIIRFQITGILKK